MGILSWGFGEWQQRFSDCVAEVYAILCSCKEGLCQESTLRGFRREVSSYSHRYPAMRI